jgi:hypothetical protein
MELVILVSTALASVVFGSPVPLLVGVAAIVLIMPK